jgi:hypothetical protein
MLCFGRTEALLIVARALQGISGAVVWTVGKPQSFGIWVDRKALPWLLTRFQRVELVRPWHGSPRPCPWVSFSDLSWVG